MLTGSRELATAAARAAASKQAEDIVVLDVSELISITDCFVICSAASDRQVNTIAEEVVKALKENEVRPVRREGDSAARWVLLDFVDFVVHVFHHEQREFYRLENLWRDAPVIEWEPEPEASSG
jgi:ribosome-associated protein